MPKKNNKTEKHSTSKSASPSKSKNNQTNNNLENMNDCKGGAANSLKNHSAQNKSEPESCR